MYSQTVSHISTKNNRVLYSLCITLCYANEYVDRSQSQENRLLKCGFVGVYARLVERSIITDVELLKLSLIHICISDVTGHIT